jgi:trans-o-hydroxybenzylidenepyruvate hydratase-aldolase
MLTKQDIHGVSAMMVTPAIEGGENLDTTNTVDLEETARATEKMIQAGVGNIAINGTTGECAGLLWEERLAFVDTVVQVNKGRLPIFAGATSLGTRETIRQMKALKDLGADGNFIGLPLWQTPTLNNSVGWYHDLGEMMPDMPIMVYANAMFFKTTFPPEFWEGVAKNAPTVITCKAGATTTDKLAEILPVAGHAIAFNPIDNAAPAAYHQFGDQIRGMWSTASNMGPEPVVALMEAMEQGDLERMDTIFADIRSLPSATPEGKFSEFAAYNVQANKAFTNAAGFIKAGPTRAPYRDLPVDWQVASQAHGKAWAELRKKYVKPGV